MHTADTPQSKKKYILHAQRLMLMVMLMKMLSFFQVGQDLLCVLVAHLLCHVGQLVRGAHLRGQLTQTTQTHTLRNNVASKRLKTEF